MDAFGWILLVGYLVAIGVICVYGAHRYWLVGAFLRRSRDAPLPSAHFDEPPAITVQLPMFNEARVAARIIHAAAHLDYPREKLQIQVLDDSTDACAEIARCEVERLRGEGVDIVYHHRSHRLGYKAGALGEGLETARGELIAVFDADFVPPSDLLRRTVDHFTDEAIGMVQTRWDHINRDETLLTRLQAICLDSHFLIEQSVRSATGRWFNFNGTAGVWRRTCIDEAGGWHRDTLTEDTDLSYRAQLKGWRFRFLPDVLCPAEIPPTVSALVNQQHRWTKGLIQTAIKLLPRVLRSTAPTAVKVEAWFHLTSPLVYVAILLLSVLGAASMWRAAPHEALAPLVAPLAALTCLALGSIAAGVFFLVAQAAQRRSIVRSAILVLPLMAIGVGVSVVNTRAVLEALLGIDSPFVRTPKYDGMRSAAADPALRRRGLRLPGGLVEACLACLLVGSLLAGAALPVKLVGTPFLLLFAIGYAAVGLPRLHAWLAAHS